MDFIKNFLIGLFYFVPTMMMVYLAYISFFKNNDIGLGFISLFGIFMVGAMSFLAFKNAFESVLNSKEK